MAQIATLLTTVLTMAGGTAVLTFDPVSGPGGVANTSVLRSIDSGAVESAAVPSPLRREGRSFRLAVTVNAHPIDFLVDTGASTTVLTVADAKAAGLHLGPERSITGIGGAIDVRTTSFLLETATGPAEVRALVAPETPVSLLGMDALYAMGTPTLTID